MRAPGYGELKTFTREYLDPDAQKTADEGRRLQKLLEATGVATTLESMVTAIDAIRREREGLEPRWKGRASIVGVLRPVQQAMAKEFGFEPTLIQVAQLLVKMYLEKKNG